MERTGRRIGARPGPPTYGIGAATPVRWCYANEGGKGGGKKGPEQSSRSREPYQQSLGVGEAPERRNRWRRLELWWWWRGRELWRLVVGLGLTKVESKAVASILK